MTEILPSEEIGKEILALLESMKETCSEIKALYLFGSFGTKKYRKESDIDLAVLADKKLTHEQLLDLKLGLEMIYHKDVDLIDLQQATTVMRAQIFSPKRRIFCTDEVFCAYFEMYAYSDYARLNEERKPVLERFYGKKITLGNYGS